MNKCGIFFIFLKVFCILNAQNFRYVQEDWYIITKPGAITAIAEGNFNLYFATENGVYRHDKAREDFQYDYSLSVQLEFPKIAHFYFDSYRDYFWVVHNNGVSFKSAIKSVETEPNDLKKANEKLNDIEKEIKNISEEN